MSLKDDFQRDQKGLAEIEKQGMVLLCIAGVRELLKFESSRAIEKLRLASIKVRLVTGEERKFARKLAQEAKILGSEEEQDSLVEGHFFQEKVRGLVCKYCGTPFCECSLSGTRPRLEIVSQPREFNTLYQKLDVLCSADSYQKKTLIVGMRERSHTVAFVGVSAKDVTALLASDVGFALGINSVKATREACGIILLNDQIDSILMAVLWGRNLLISLRKVMQFHLTLIIVAIVICTIGAMVLRQSIFSPVQILWVLLAIETLASITLSKDNPVYSLLEKKPFAAHKSLLSKKMTKHIIMQVLYQVLVLMVLIFYGEMFLPEYADSFDQEITSKNLNASVKYNGGTIKYNDFYLILPSFWKEYVRSGRYDSNNTSQSLENTYGSSRHFTIIYNTFVWMQIFNFFNCSRIRDENFSFQELKARFPYFIYAFLMILLQGIVITFGSWIFQTYQWQDSQTGLAGLQAKQWGICIAFGMGSGIVAWLTKLIPVK